MKSDDPLNVGAAYSFSLSDHDGGIDVEKDHLTPALRRVAPLIVWAKHGLDLPA